MGTGHEHEDFDFDSIQIENPEQLDESAFQYAEMLLDQCTLPEDQKVTMQHEINDCVLPFELKEIIDRLLQCQPDRIDGGLNYGQRDIIRKLKRFV